MAPLLPITLVVITRNEAQKIARGLDSVPFAAEKLVVDSGSTDNTVAIAQAHGARVVYQDWLGFGPQRNVAATHSSHPWMIVLDADEYLSPPLIDQLQNRLPALLESDACAGLLRRHLIYMGKPMRWYRPAVGEKMARIYHRDRARWRDVRVHESLKYDGTAITFDAPFLHDNNPSLVEKQLKVSLYAELKCRDWMDKNKPTRMWQTPFVFVLAFIKDYVFRLGFLDGWRGYAISQTAASYAAYKRMRYYEMRQNPVSRDTAAAALRRSGLDQ